MGLFFSPDMKVQKDRAVLKKIDHDLANRSLPGVFSYFLVYLVLDFLMGYPDEHRIFSFSFGLVALVIAAARIFIALGFEKHYSRGPARWRAWFLWLSLLNSIIWGVLLSFVLIHEEFSHATTLALVYTAALTSGVTMVYAQYVRFVKIYLLVVLLPPIFILFIQFNSLDMLMSLGVLGYLVFLYSESLKYHHSFWQRVHSQAQLEQKVALLNASRIENEQRAFVNENALSTVMQMIKTPLQGVLGMLSILSDTKLNEEQKQSLMVANQSGDDLVNLIADLEDFTQLRNGNIQIENKFFDLRKYTEHLLESLGPIAHQLCIELSFLYNINVPSRVSLDKKQIGQVIQSLVGFALHHSKGGEVVFKVSSEEYPDSKKSFIRFCTYFNNQDLDIDSIKIQIRDMQIDESTELNSSILSLMIGSRLVELMGGSIDFKVLDNGVARVAFFVPMEASSQQIDAFQPHKSLKDRSLILVDLTNKAGMGIAAEATSWGMNVEVTTSDVLYSSKTLPKADYYIVNIPLGIELTNIYKRIDQILSKVSDDAQVIVYGTASNRAHICEKYSQIVCLAKPAGRYSMHRALLSIQQSEYKDDLNIKVLEQNSERKILIAEDNPVNKLVTEALVKKLGYRYHSVTDGKELIKAIENEKFDLILMDCHMPVMDGFEATQNIRANKLDQISKIPIIALTAKASVDEERHCMMVGMDDCLAKPITLNVLNASIQRWLE